MEVFEGIDLLRLGKKTLGIGSLLKSYMHLHKIFIDSWEINGKKGGSIVHFVELGLIFDSFQVGLGGVGEGMETHLVEFKCTFAPLLLGANFMITFHKAFECIIEEVNKMRQG